MEVLLGRVFECGDDRAYDLIFYDWKALHLKHKIVTFDELKTIENGNFTIKDNALQCSSVIPSVRVSQDDLKRYLAVEHDLELEHGGFISLILEGLDNGYYLVDGEPSDWASGSQITPFSSIKISKTTMSVYARVHTKTNDFYNKMLIVLDNGVLKMKEFKFAVPVGMSPTGSFVATGEKFIINDKEYIVYNSGTLLIWEPDSWFAPDLVNQECCDVNVDTEALKVLDKFIARLLPDAPKGEYVGGTHDYKSSYGVYIDSTSSTLSKTTQNFLVDSLFRFNSIEEYSSVVDEDLQNRRAYNHTSMYTKKLLTFVMYSGGGHADILQRALLLKNNLKDRILRKSLYLYIIRVHIYCTKHNPVLGELVGGNTTDCSIINAVFN